MFVHFLVIHYKAIIALLMLILSIPPSVYYLRKLISSIYANKYLRNTDNVKFDRDTIILASQCYVKPRCGTADPTQGAELSSLNCGNKLFKEADKFIKKGYINKFMIVF